MGYVTISELSRPWQVDRAKVRAALQRTGIHRNDPFASPRYTWDDFLRKIQARADAALEQIDRDAALKIAESFRRETGRTAHSERPRGLIRAPGRPRKSHPIRLGGSPTTPDNKGS